MLKLCPPFLSEGLGIEHMKLVTRPDVQDAIQQEGRPRGLNVTAPDFRACPAVQRLQLLHLNRDVDALRIHRTAGRRKRIERDDPLLFDGKKRKWNGWNLLRAR